MDSPYLTHYPFLEFLINWGGYLLLVTLTLSPIIYLFFNKRRLIEWKYLIAVYPLSFAIAAALFWFVLDPLDPWIQKKLLTTHWMSIAYDSATVRWFMTLPLLWPVSTFFLAVRRWWGGYSMVVMLSNIVVAFLMFGLLIAVWIYMIAWGLGQLSNYL